MKTQVRQKCEANNSHQNLTERERESSDIFLRTLMVTDKKISTAECMLSAPSSSNMHHPRREAMKHYNFKSILNHRSLVPESNCFSNVSITMSWTAKRPSKVHYCVGCCYLFFFPHPTPANMQDSGIYLYWKQKKRVDKNMHPLTPMQAVISSQKQQNDLPLKITTKDHLDLEFLP